MTTASWLLCYGANALFWLWIARWGGAEKLEATFASGCLVSWFAPNWSADGLRLFAYIMLLGSSALFVAGLLWPEWRRVPFPGALAWQSGLMGHGCPA